MCSIGFYFYVFSLGLYLNTFSTFRSKIQLSYILIKEIFHVDFIHVFKIILLILSYFYKDFSSLLFVFTLKLDDLTKFSII